jgi:hypothetical protein
MRGGSNVRRIPSATDVVAEAIHGAGPNSALTRLPAELLTMISEAYRLLRGPTPAVFAQTNLRALHYG